VSRTSRPSRTNGFTLIEMVGALLLVIALGSLGLATATRPSARSEAGSVALRMRAMLSAALAGADLEGGDVVVRAEAGAAGGRFLALSGPPGVNPADDPAADWVELAGGVRWRTGTAAADPMGAPTDGRVPGTIRCSATACETGTADYVVYFVGHARSARVSWALVLTRDREVSLFRWNPASTAWEAGAR
jgi:type II secretory pathway pseudopilin PulG